MSARKEDRWEVHHARRVYHGHILMVDFNDDPRKRLNWGWRVFLAENLQAPLCYGDARNEKEAKLKARRWVDTLRRQYALTLRPRR